MSLQTDSVFISALRADSQLMQDIGGQLYGTAIPLPDEDMDNVDVPYVIVQYNGMTNDTQSKDYWEGEYDNVQIGITVTGATLTALHDLTQRVRTAVHSYISEGESEVLGYQLTADSIQYDADKPCYWQVLRYQCETLKN